MVFYPDDVPVGIVGGRAAADSLLIIHRADSTSNVVTGKSGDTCMVRHCTTHELELCEGCFQLNGSEDKRRDKLFSLTFSVLKGDQQ